MKIVATLFLGALALGSVSCGNGNRSKTGELSGELSLSGAFALYPVAVQWAEEFQTLHPEGQEKG